MLKKPFELAFFYTPKWKSNREREKSEQLVFKMRDLPESKRLAEQERIYDELKVSTPEEIAKTDVTKYFLTLRGASLDMTKEFVKKYVVSFQPFVVENVESNEQVTVSTVDDISVYCSDLISELYGRLFNGPDADELKN